MKRIDVRITFGNQVRATLYVRIGLTDVALKTWEYKHGENWCMVWRLATKRGVPVFHKGDYLFNGKGYILKGD